MKYFFLALVAVVGLVAGCEAFAQTVCPTDAVASNAARVCWRNATELADPPGGPIVAPLALEQTQVMYGACTATAAPATISLTTVPASIGFVLYENLAPGVWCFRARHQLNNGEWGQPTGWVRKTLTAPSPPRPGRPTNVTVG